MPSCSFFIAIAFACPVITPEESTSEAIADDIKRSPNAFVTSPLYNSRAESSTTATPTEARSSMIQKKQKNAARPPSFPAPMLTSVALVGWVAST